MPLRHVLAALLVASRVSTLEAWGSSGHEIVGQVAEELLSEGGKGYVANILGNESLVTIANWADTITRTQPWSMGLHFINVEECTSAVFADRQKRSGLDQLLGSTACTFTYSRDCVGDSCVAGAIANYTGRLSSAVDLYTDLKFLTHFVGDAHQPLHCARAEDKGGNTISPVFYDVTDQGGEWDLHQIWDFGMIENHVAASFGGDASLFGESLVKAVKEGGEYYDKVEDWTSCLPSSSVECSSLWGQESVDLSLSQAYVDVTGEQITANFTVTDEYVEARIEVVSERLAQAGVRLAQLIEALAGGEIGGEIRK